MPQDRTDSQKAAARANGQKSRGPKSPHGKLASSRNALKHGLLASSLLLPDESPTHFKELADSLLLEFCPQTPVELMLVQRMLAAQWRLLRVWAFEQAGMLQQTAASLDTASVPTSEGVWNVPAARSAAAFQALHTRGGSGAGSVIQISEMRYQRQFAQAVLQLRQLRAAAKNSENRETNPGTP